MSSRKAEAGWRTIMQWTLNVPPYSFIIRGWGEFPSNPNNIGIARISFRVQIKEERHCTMMPATAAVVEVLAWPRYLSAETRRAILGCKNDQTVKQSLFQK